MKNKEIVNVAVVYVQMMRVVEIETETPSLSSYVDIIKKDVLLIGDKNLSTCKKAGQVLVAIGNEKRNVLVSIGRDEAHISSRYYISSY